jgi:hypothetical protein
MEKDGSSVESSRRKVVLVALAAALAIGYALYIYKKSEHKYPRTVTTTQIGRRTQFSDCTPNGVLPDPECSPGDIFPDAIIGRICIKGYSSSVRHVSESTKREVYEEYGVASHHRGQYEVDHIISLELGGSNDIANLWPEPAEPKPGFHEKDKVENYLHREVCDHKLALATAQDEIVHDWLRVYEQIESQG